MPPETSGRRPGQIVQNALAAALILLPALAAPGCAARKPEPSLVPPMDVDMEQRVLHEFYDEIQDYVRLRRKVVDKVPPPQPGASAEEIGTWQKAITIAIIAYRKDAKQGEIFEPKVEAAFRHVVAQEMAGPEGPAILNELRSGNPRVEGVPRQSNPTQEMASPTVVLRVNAHYPEGAPFSSVPPTLLLKLPQLPDQVRYRFVGRSLILRDTEANIILDYIADIIPGRSIPR
ncbi:MAG TPA: hypothetical protein VF310_04960 [Vicinamibacteria bacterium]